MGPIVILPLAAAIAIASRRKIEETIALSMYIVVGILFVSGIISDFIPGIYFWVILTVASCMYCIYKMIRDLKGIKGYLFTSGLLAYFIYLIYFLIINYHRGLTHSDDLRCWGLAVKNYYYYSDFLTAQATDQAALHPPAVRLWNYFSTKMWVTYSGGICLFAQDMLTVATLLPFFALVKDHSEWKKWFSLFIVVILIPLVGNTETYVSLYPDNLLGILSAYAICMFLLWLRTDHTFYMVASEAGLFMVCMTKRTGILLGGIILLIMSAVFFLQAFEHRAKSKRNLLYLLLTFIIFTVPIGMWYVIRYIAIQNCDNPLQILATGIGTILAGILIAVMLFYIKNKRVLIELVFGSLLVISLLLFLMAYYYGKKYDLSYAYSMSNVYLCSLLTTEFCSIGDVIPMSFAAVTLVFVCIRVLYRQYVQRKVCSEDELRLQDALTCSILTGIGFYVAMILAAYIVAIGPANGDGGLYLPSYGRYLMPCLLILILLCMFLGYTELYQYGNKIYFVIMVCIMVAASSGGIISPVFAKPQQAEFYAFEHGNVTLTSKDRIFLVAMDVHGIERDKDIEDKFYYAVFPAESEFRSSTMHLDGIEKERLLSADEWQQQISANGDSYVYLQTVSADFAARYGSLFERVSDIGNGRVYKVSYGGNDKMVLKLLGK